MSANQTPGRSPSFSPTNPSSSRSRPPTESFNPTTSLSSRSRPPTESSIPTTPLPSRSRPQTEVSDDIVEKYQRGEPIPAGMVSAARARAREQQQSRPSQPIPATQGTERAEAARSESVSRPPQLGPGPPPPPANALAQLSPGTPSPGPSVAFGASFPSVEFSPAVTASSLAPAAPSTAVVFGAPAPRGGTLFGNVLPAVPFNPALPDVSRRPASVSASSAEVTIPQGFIFGAGNSSATASPAFTLGGSDTVWHDSTLFDTRVFETPCPATVGSVWDDPALFDPRHREVEEAERARDAPPAGESVLKTAPRAKADRKVRLSMEHREWIAKALGKLAPEDRNSVRDFVASKVHLEGADPSSILKVRRLPWRHFDELIGVLSHKCGWEEPVWGQETEYSDASSPVTGLPADLEDRAAIEAAAGDASSTSSSSLGDLVDQLEAELAMSDAEFEELVKRREENTSAATAPADGADTEMLEGPALGEENTLASRTPALGHDDDDDDDDDEKEVEMLDRPVRGEENTPGPRAAAAPVDTEDAETQAGPERGEENILALRTSALGGAVHAPGGGPVDSSPLPSTPGQSTGLDTPGDQPTSRQQRRRLQRQQRRTQQQLVQPAPRGQQQQQQQVEQQQAQRELIREQERRQQQEEQQQQQAEREAEQERRREEEAAGLARQRAQQDDDEEDGERKLVPEKNEEDPAQAPQSAREAVRMSEEEQERQNQTQQLPGLEQQQQTGMPLEQESQTDRLPSPEAQPPLVSGLNTQLRREDELERMVGIERSKVVELEAALVHAQAAAAEESRSLQNHTEEKLASQRNEFGLVVQSLQSLGKDNEARLELELSRNAELMSQLELANSDKFRAEEAERRLEEAKAQHLSDTASLKAEHETALQHFASAQAVAVEFQARLVDASGQIAALELQQAEGQRELSGLKGQLDELRSMSETVESERQRDLGALKARGERQLQEQAETHRAAMQASRAAFEALLAEKDRALEEAETVATDGWRQAAEDAKSELAAKISELEEARNQIAAQVVGRQAHLRRISDLEAAKTTAKERADGLRSELDEAEAQIEQHDAVRADWSRQAERALIATRAANAMKRAAEESERESSEDNKNLLMRNAELCQKLEQASAERDRTAAELLELEAARAKSTPRAEEAEEVRRLQEVVLSNTEQVGQQVEQLFRQLETVSAERDSKAAELLDLRAARAMSTPRAEESEEVRRLQQDVLRNTEQVERQVEQLFEQLQATSAERDFAASELLMFEAARAMTPPPAETEDARRLQSELDRNAELVGQLQAASAERERTDAELRRLRDILTFIPPPLISVDDLDGLRKELDREKAASAVLRAELQEARTKEIARSDAATQTTAEPAQQPPVLIHQGRPAPGRGPLRSAFGVTLALLFGILFGAGIACISVRLLSMYVATEDIASGRLNGYWAPGFRGLMDSRAQYDLQSTRYACNRFWWLLWGQTPAWAVKVAFDWNQWWAGDSWWPFLDGDVVLPLLRRASG